MALMMVVAEAGTVEEMEAGLRLCEIPVQRVVPLTEAIPVLLDFLSQVLPAGTQSAPRVEPEASLKAC